MTTPPVIDLKIILAGRLSSLLRLLLLRGIRFETTPGQSVQNFLAETLPTDRNYIENSIQTIFLDGQAIDNPETTLITDPCTIALSVAMPGVFGAAFRKNGVYSGLRQRYEGNQRKTSVTEPSGNILVTVKCFNRVAEDLGDDLLARGIRLNIEDFTEFWQQHKGVLGKGCRQIVVDGRQETGSRNLMEMLRGLTGDLTLAIETVAEES
ncbi:MAG: hypothetical protein SWH68_12270 [Thermodesulfobacteriota bacterium]|nr:hypothetical protein [Thermodesulfobacteriota bacterium]